MFSHLVMLGLREIPRNRLVPMIGGLRPRYRIVLAFPCRSDDGKGPAGSIWDDVVDGLIYGLLTAGTCRWLWPR